MKWITKFPLHARVRIYKKERFDLVFRQTGLFMSTSLIFPADSFGLPRGTGQLYVWESYLKYVNTHTHTHTIYYYIIMALRERIVSSSCTIYFVQSADSREEYDYSCLVELAYTPPVNLATAARRLRSVCTGITRVKRTKRIIAYRKRMRKKFRYR